MKLHQLEETTTKDKAAEALAQHFVDEAKREAGITQEVQGVAADEEMLYKEAKKKAKEFMEKVDVEIYHLIY